MDDGEQWLGCSQADLPGPNGDSKTNKHEFLFLLPWGWKLLETLGNSAHYFQSLTVLGFLAAKFMRRFLHKTHFPLSRTEVSLKVFFSPVVWLFIQLYTDSPK